MCPLLTRIFSNEYRHVKIVKFVLHFYSDSCMKVFFQDLFRFRLNKIIFLIIFFNGNSYDNHNNTGVASLTSQVTCICAFLLGLCSFVWHPPLCLYGRSSLLFRAGKFFCLGYNLIQYKEFELLLFGLNFLTNCYQEILYFKMHFTS